MSEFCYAVVSDEGIVGWYHPETREWIALVTFAHKEKLYDKARLIAKTTGKTLRLVEYREPKTLETFQP